MEAVYYEGIWDGYNPELDLWDNTRTTKLNEYPKSRDIMRRIDEYLLEKK